MNGISLRASRIEFLKSEIERLEGLLAAEELLQEVFNETHSGLAISSTLRYKIQDHLGYDDSE